MQKYLDMAKAAVPTEIVYGENCIRENAKKLILGERALIVTGKSSAKNGALQDVKDALSSQNIDYTLYDRVAPNPTVFCVREAVALLKSAGADFIVAVGGGSPMDAAKAAATFAVQDRPDEDVFKGGYEDLALPMAHVPTTAGTGSEVTPYAILTNDCAKTKTSIASKAMFPRIAFLDAKYMRSLNRDTTVNTAVDALSHAVEGMFSVKATSQTDEMALGAVSMIFGEAEGLKKFELAKKDRETLLVASTLAGAVIAHTGTTIVHAMGYPLTYYYDIDHGRANGLLLGKMLELCEERLPERTADILKACGLTSARDFTAFLAELMGTPEDISARELTSYALEVSKSKKLPNIVYHPDYDDILSIYLESFGKSFSR